MTNHNTEKVSVDFSKALAACNNGHKVSRIKWNYDAYIFKTGTGQCKDEYKVINYSSQRVIPQTMVMKTNDDQFVPWTPTQADLFADDYMILPEHLRNESNELHNADDDTHRFCNPNIQKPHGNTLSGKYDGNNSLCFTDGPEWSGGFAHKCATTPSIHHTNEQTSKLHAKEAEHCIPNPLIECVKDWSTKPTWPTLQQVLEKIKETNETDLDDISAEDIETYKIIKEKLHVKSLEDNTLLHRSLGHRHETEMAHEELMDSKEMPNWYVKDQLDNKLDSLGITDLHERRADQSKYGSIKEDKTVTEVLRMLNLKYTTEGNHEFVKYTTEERQFYKFVIYRPDGSDYLNVETLYKGFAISGGKTYDLMKTLTFYIK